MRKVARASIALGGALALVAALAWSFTLDPLPAQTTLTRRDALLGLLTLGVLAMAAFGFDLRDWL